MVADSPNQPKKEGEDTVTTGVDNLIDLLKQHDRISMEEAAASLKVAKKVLQAWVEFLVEEKIVGIEYNFTTPFIYLNTKKNVKSKAKKIKETTLNFGVFKQEYFKKARAQKIPDSNIEKYWINHLKSKLENSKDFFMRETRKRNIPNGEELWRTYYEKATNV